MDVDASRLELGPGATAELVVAEGGEEMRLVGEQGELDRGHASAATGLLPLVGRVRDLARPGQSLDPREPDPLDVPDDGDLHVAPVSQMTAARRTFPRDLTNRVPPPFHG